ncbi:DMT family protein [Neisseriaceae bacterium B1]
MHYLITISLLTASNLLMTFSWYWHIKPTATPLPIWQIVLISWAIALLEYCFAVPANHFGAQWGIKPFQLKILQEVIALTVFASFAFLYLNEKITLNYLMSFLCILGAVYFAFKK